MYKKTVKLFLRLAIAGGFLSAVADRFGLWGYHVAWGNWEHFIAYTHTILPWLSAPMVQIAAIIATVLEVIFSICLIIGYKTEWIAKMSGILLLIFALCMSFSTGIKTAFDASVFTASAAAFALSLIKTKFLELDILFIRKKRRLFS